jgi:hypothetical protein
MYTVELQYFKEHGKYYASGTYETSKEHIFEISEEVDAMLKAGIRPGLGNGHSGFHVYVICPDHPNNFPLLKLSKA